MRPELDDPVIRRYLLGLLPDEEAEALEDAYLGSPEVLSRVRAVEDDLLDDYAADRLAPGERTVFERLYLASPRLRERVVAARALRLAALGERGSRMRWRGPVAMAAGLLLAVLALTLWGPRERAKVAVAPTPAPSITAAAAPTPSPSGAAEPLVSPSSASPRPRARALTRVVFALSPVLLRGPEASRELRVPSGTATVVLELLGDPAMRPGGAARLAVDIRTVEGAAVWSGRPSRGARNRPAVAAVAEVPAGGLGPGDYIVTLSSGEDVLQRYFFRVRRADR